MFSFSRFDEFLAHKLKSSGELSPFSRKSRKESPNGHNIGGLGNPVGQECETLLKSDRKQNLHLAIFSHLLIFMPVSDFFWGSLPKKTSVLGCLFVFFFFFTKKSKRMQQPTVKKTCYPMSSKHCGHNIFH